MRAIELTSAAGVSVTVIEYGAALQALVMPDRHGRLADVVLGYPTIDGYVATRDYCGATVGRFANRIAGSRFAIDGREYAVPGNDGPHALHSGPLGLDKQLWTVCDPENDEASVTMRHVSPDGDQGYPGNLIVDATYSVTEDNVLKIEYRAATDRPTIVNVTNHAYWNLAGDIRRSAAAQMLTIYADAFAPVDRTILPTTELRPVEGTPFDFRAAHSISQRLNNSQDDQIAIAGGYDHNFVVAPSCSSEPRRVARIEDPASGRSMEMWSNQPGLQFYSGNALDGLMPGKTGRAHHPRDGIALEPQCFPDTPNRPQFGSAVLRPGETYHHLIECRLSSGRSQ